MSTRSVAVFCGSRNGSDPVYMRHAGELGKLMALQRLRLIYGGGHKGIMGSLADGALGHGGEVVGVIPHQLVEWEQLHQGLTEVIRVPDMHTRKKIMYEMSDAAVMMPGGFGTLDEFFEMLTWNQLKIHDKKIYILNSGGFYDDLRTHMEKTEREQFLYEPLADRVRFCAGPAELLSSIQSP